MHTQRWIAAATVLTVALATLAVGAAPAGATGGSAVYGASATLSGPVTTGHIVVPLSAVSTNMAAHGYEQQEYFASGTAHAFEATSSPSDGRLTVAADDVGRLRDPHHRAPPDVTQEVQRHRRGRVAQRVGRRVLTRLGLPQPDADARRLCLGRRVGPGACHRWWFLHPRRPDGRRPRARGAEPLRVPPPPRRPVRARYVRPDRPGPAPQSRGRRIRVPQPAPHRGHRRIPVGLLHDRLRRRPPAGHARLRRDLHPQSRRLGDPASARAAD